MLCQHLQRLKPLRNSSVRLCRNKTGAIGAHRRGFSRSYTASSTSSSHSKSFKYILNAKASCQGKKCSKGTYLSGMSSPDNCGEDSFFVTPTVCGVADGVGGWNEYNVDPSKVSRFIMQHAHQLVQNAADIDKVNSLEVLKVSYKEMLRDPSVEAGSTTVCMVQLKTRAENGQPILEYTNLGDSGFLIVRGNEVVFRSKFQSIGPAPYQLAKIPPQFRDQGAIETQPEEADTGEVEVQEGDIVILATDGVWDNFSRDLEELPPFFPPLNSWRHYWHGPIQSFLDVLYQDENANEKMKVESVDKKGLCVSAIAERIVEASIRHGLKPDDVTVVVASVEKVEQ